MTIARTGIFFALLAVLPLTAQDLPREAPPLTVETVSGDTISLDDLRGKVVAVIFFSTDCPHCQETTRILAPIYEEWKSRGLEILGLAINPSAQKNLKAFKLQYGANFPLALSSRAEWTRFAGLSMMARLYVPYLVIVDREGRIREIHPGQDRRYWKDQAANLQKSFDALLSEPAPAS